MTDAVPETIVLTNANIASIAARTGLTTTELSNHISKSKTAKVQPIIVISPDAIEIKTG